MLPNWCNPPELVQCRAGAVRAGGLETAMRIGYDDADTLITYPHAHNLSACEQPIRVGGWVGLGACTWPSRCLFA